MILRRVHVRHFRGLHDLALDGLDPTLNLFHGPNESGKSTLVEAIHVGLFERSAGEAERKRELRSWGGTEAPEVTLEFEDDDGNPWVVHKRFLQQQSTELSDRNRRWKGEEAEAKLRALFGTRPGNKHGTRDEDLGIWPILWVRQGRSGVPVKNDTNADAHAALSETLARATGEIAAGPVGDAVRERARKLFLEHHTAGGGLNVETRRILDAAEQAAAEVARSEALVTEAQADVDELQQQQARARELEPRCAALRRQADASAARAREADRHAQGVLAARATREVAKMGLRDAERARTEAEGLHDQLRGARQAEVEAEAARAEAARVADESESRRVALVAAVETARAEAELARRAWARAVAAAGRKGVEDRCAAARRRRADAEALEQERRNLQHALDAQPGSLADLAAVEELERRVGDLEARLLASAPRLVVTARVDVAVDGAELREGEARLVPLPPGRSVDVDGRLRVALDAPPTPTQRELDEARAALSQRLAVLGVPDVAATRRLRAEREELSRKVGAAIERLRLVAPDGLPPLVAEERAAERALADLGEPVEVDTDAAVERRDAAEARLAEAEGTARAQDAAARTADRTRQDAVTAARVASAQVQTLTARTEALPKLEQLRDAEAGAREAFAVAERALGVAEAAFRDAGGNEAASAAERDREAADGLDARLNQARIAVATLRERVANRSRQGLHEALQEARDREAEARATADALRVRADVRRRAHEALERAYTRMRDRFVEPVRAAIEREIPLLFPGSRLWIDSQGDVVGLVTYGVEERFEDLSGGAREQLGVLVRLGLARVLAGPRRLPVILDDALVNSDSERRQRMVEVLRRMSEHLQILVFTCHDEDFDRLAARHVGEVRGRPPRRSRPTT